MRRFAFDRWAMLVLVLAALVGASLNWLRDHPEHNPWAPLRLQDPPGWATGRKLVALRDDPAECREFLRRSAIAFTDLPPAGAGQCSRSDRILVAPDPASGLALHPRRAEASCAIAAGLALWLHGGVQPAAERLLKSRVVAIEHFGTDNCRRIGGGPVGRWSEHATGNAIDVAAFVLADGRRIAVRTDWRRPGAASAFLHAARDAACGTFGTVLSPDYNAAHADHFHLDQAGSRRGWSFCR